MRALILPVMQRAWALSSLLLLAPAASAQDTPERVPEPTSDDGALSDEELIRWAANEVRVYEGRPPEPPRPPVPPDGYIGTGVDGHVVLPGEAGRDALRFLAELGGGALGVVVGGGVGALLVWGAIEGNVGPEWTLAALATAGALGAFGVTTGVVLGAEAVGGRGRYGDTFIGQLIGAVAALPVVTVGVANDAPALALVAAGVLPLAGAVLAYEVSHADRSAAQLVYVTPLPEGALGGVAGAM